MATVVINHPAEETSAIDLTREAAALKAAGTDYELYALATEDAQGYLSTPYGSMLWIPSVGRAGIEMGAEAAWTDASSPEDALHRYNTGDDWCN